MEPYYVKLGDVSYGRNTQAHLLLTYLSMQDFSLPQQPYAYLTTTPYCNCREQGFVISLHIKSMRYNYCFYEHRNSDSLCVLMWQGLIPVSGAVTPDDIPHFTDKYIVDKSFGYMQLFEAYQWLEGELRKVIESVLEQEEERSKV